MFRYLRNLPISVNHLIHIRYYYYYHDYKACASDRLFEIDLNRRIATGTLSEIVGTGGLKGIRSKHHPSFAE